MSENDLEDLLKKMAGPLRFSASVGLHEAQKCAFPKRFQVLQLLYQEAYFDNHWCRLNRDQDIK